MFPTPEEYRRKAEEWEAMARETRNEALRQQFEEVARRWRELAKDVEYGRW